MQLSLIYSEYVHPCSRNAVGSPSGRWLRSGVLLKVVRDGEAQALSRRFTRNIVRANAARLSKIQTQTVLPDTPLCCLCCAVEEEENEAAQAQEEETALEVDAARRAPGSVWRGPVARGEMAP